MYSQQNEAGWTNEQVTRRSYFRRNPLFYNEYLCFYEHFYEQRMMKDFGGLVAEQTRGK